MTHHDKSPERIWAWNDETPTEKDKSWSACDAGTGSVEYVRADAITAQAEENRRLREALEPFASSWKIAQASGLTDMENLGAISRNETAAISFMRAFSALSSTGEKG